MSRYLSVLEASFVVRRLAPYLKSRATRLIMAAKCYVFNASVEQYELNAYRDLDEID